jgi:hypothetical protein
VLIGIPDSGKGSFCSASHIDLGLVATNAHCVEQWRDLGPGRYYVVFYDPAGLKKWARVESFVYIGNAAADDIAILKIPTAAALQWQTAGKLAKVVPLAQPTTDKPNPDPISFPIHIWAFDPFEPSHPDLAAKYQSSAGMIFKPRTCQMMRSKPILMGAKMPETGTPQRAPIHSNKTNPALHFFVDSCDRMPVHGNSGSLVTIAEHFAEKVGVYHWGIGTRDGKETFDYVEYTGTDGKTKYLHDPAEWQDIFGVGYLFEHFQMKHPQVLF